MINLLSKEYDGNSIIDASEDLFEAFDADFNPDIKKVPKDEQGFMKGKFKLELTWEPE